MLRPGDMMSLMDISSEAIGTQPMAKIDTEITPILAELITLGVENYEHPSVEQLFNWLVAPERTGEEFFYVTGPLQQYVGTVMIEHFKQYIDPMGYAGIPAKYTVKVAAEAMAVISPILVGHWEHTAWVLVNESSSYSPDDFGFFSKRLTSWIISVIGDPSLCPNHYLRMELMALISNTGMLDLDDYKSLRPHAIESVLSACSNLNIDYLLQSEPHHGDYHQMNLDEIMSVLNCITDDLETEFDESLSEKLQNLKALRLSAQVHDIAYKCAVQFNKFEQPKSLHGLNAILKTFYCYIQINYKHYQNKNSNLFSPFYGIDGIIHLLNDFICIFRKSCLTPQLAGLTATCILTIMEMVMSEYVIKECRNSLSTTGMLLTNLFRVKDKNSLLYPNSESQKDMAVFLEYKDRLINLKNNYFNQI